jgi:hypothetical protein
MSADQLEDDYKVGYRKPPRHTQFKKGRSGNPRGVPPSRTLPEAVAVAFDPVTTVTVSGKRQRMRTQDVFAMSQVQKAIAGDAKAAKLVAGLKLQAPQPQIITPDAEIQEDIVEALRSLSLEELEAYHKFNQLMIKAQERRRRK